MSTVTITIPTDEKTAEAYRSASSEDQRKMQLLLGLRLKDYLDSPHRSLTEIMDEIGAEAQAHGLTPEILEQLLNDA